MKELSELKQQHEDNIKILYNMFIYTTYPEYKKEIKPFYTPEDIKEMRKLYTINKFGNIMSFKSFIKIVKKTSITMLQSPYTTINDFIRDYDIIFLEFKMKNKILE